MHFHNFELMKIISYFVSLCILLSVMILVLMKYYDKDWKIVHGMSLFLVHILVSVLFQICKPFVLLSMTLSLIVYYFLSFLTVRVTSWIPVVHIVKRFDKPTIFFIYDSMMLALWHYSLGFEHSSLIAPCVVVVVGSIFSICLLFIKTLAFDYKFSIGVVLSFGE